MIPVELLTLGVSTIAGGLMKGWGMALEAKREQHHQLLAMAGQRTENAVALASAGDRGFKFTRRTIALMVIFAVMVLPKVGAYMFPDLPIVYGWTSASEGLFAWLFGGEQLTWHATQGVVITPLDTNFAMAIAGLYFGSATVSHK